MVPRTAKGTWIGLLLRTDWRFSQGSPGFTLVELMIVVAIIGLLAAIAVPNYLRANQTTQINLYASDVRTACDAFTEYCADNSKYPPDTLPAAMPLGMDDYLRKFPWSLKTPIGGQWDWDNGQFGVKAGVSVYEPTISPEQLQKLDAIIDDGDLSTGNFRARSAGYIAIIEN